MQLIRLFVLTSSIALTVRGNNDCARLATDGSRLMVMQNENARVVVDGIAGIELPRWSPAGDSIAYSRPAGASSPMSIVVVRVDGAPLHTLPIAEDLGINAVLDLGWLDEWRVWIEGHVNPSVSHYYVWDVNRGEVADELFGTLFTPSPDGQHVAHLEHLPHGAPHKPRVAIDGNPVYPLRDSPGPISHLTWSADGRRLSFVEGTPDGRQLIQVDARTHRVLRTTKTNELRNETESPSRTRTSDVRCSAPLRHR